MRMMVGFIIGLFFFAQAATGQQVEYKNIFCTAYTRICIPKGEWLYMYAFQDAKWQLVDTFQIPRQTLIIDGNIRKLTFIQEDKIIFQEHYNCGGNCKTDTLVLDKKYVPAMPANWLRSISSTEYDVGFFAHGMVTVLYKYDNKWGATLYSNPITELLKKNPKTYLEMPYDKVYSFYDNLYLMTQDDRKIRFWTFDPFNTLNKDNKAKEEIISMADQLQFILPDDVLTVFPFDQNKLCWVYADKIEFYKINKERRNWQKDTSYKTFYFK